jgi:hypothetical protein
MSYFSKRELACKHCLKMGKTTEEAYYFEEDFRTTLDRIRSDCGFALVVTSGYRCHDHPIEKAKLKPGAHSTGRAVDLAVSYDKAHKLLEVALAHGVKRIGVNQKGPFSERFIHLDDADLSPAPTIWSY